MRSLKLGLILLTAFVIPTLSCAKELKPEKKMTFDELFSKNKPVIEKRGVHMHLTGLPPTPERFVKLLKIFAEARYNVVLVEWEDSFPWTVDKRFRSSAAYTPEDIRRFCKAAKDLNLELIPLVQCLREPVYRVDR